MRRRACYAAFTTPHHGPELQWPQQSLTPHLPRSILRSPSCVIRATIRCWQTAMTQYDVFNGDADGLCALHQLRLAEPADAVLITGVKGDIALLQHAPAGAGDRVTVLDVSMDANRGPLLAMLARGAAVLYVDHHSSKEIPAHPLLHALIDHSPDTCTGLIVDHHLGGRFRIWAIVAAFGDGFDTRAEQLALSIGLDPDHTAALRELGICLNYNAYGDAITDLVSHPALLYTALHRYTDPFAFMRSEPLYGRIKATRDADLDRAARRSRHLPSVAGQVVLLPDARWSRRVRGIYANQLARANPAQAHALLCARAGGGYTVSVRAPREGPDALRGADGLCRLFEGGGRPAAASIAYLPGPRRDAFIREFETAFGPSR